MIKILSKKRYDWLEQHVAALEKENMRLEAELTINKTWVEIGDQKLEKAMKKMDKLLAFKHAHKKKKV